jgi:ribosomal-protein-alanine N-acetyltransferase
MVRLSGDPEVARWQWPEAGGPRTPQEARELLLDKIAHWDRHGFGQWLWRERSSGELVGRIGLGWTAAPEELAIEVGWSVTPAKQGRGYAGEAARACLEYGFGELGMESIVAFTWTENAASLRVMEKLGMRRERGFELVGLPHLLYRATARQWTPGSAQA